MAYTGIDPRPYPDDMDLDAMRQRAAARRAETEDDLGALEQAGDKQGALEVAYLIALDQHELSKLASAVRNRIAAGLYEAKALSLTGLANLTNVTKSAAHQWVNKGSEQREDANG